MILEIRTYTLIPGKVEAYWEAYRGLDPEIRSTVMPHLLGYWQSEFGILNRVVHLWRWRDLAERERLRTALYADPRWQDHLARIRPLITTQACEIFRETPLKGLRGTLPPLPDTA